jgi:AraC-like DNA-binding protein
MELKRNDMTITGTPAEMAELIRLMTAEPKKVQKKEPTNKKDIDMGKVKALRKAGWTLEKIADEMGCSAQTIANKLKGAE